jgi:HPt (histidine-containing phosphotransfer) domain-containing protein
MSLSQLEPPLLYSSLADEPLLDELVTLFVEEMPARMARFHDYFDQRDWDGLRRAARQMKGLAGSYGFEELTPFAEQLEAAATRPAPVEEVAAALEMFSSQCARATHGAPQ